LHEHPPVLDTGRLGQIFGDDLTGAREIIEQTITDASALIDQLHTAIISGAYEQADDLAHALKGICRTVGASELAEITETLNVAVKRRNAAASLTEHAKMSRALDALREAKTHLP
jgi:HPt (histidine-containing phosphotransfer) domain-containing protein